LHGAANETELHYINGCQIKERVKEHSYFKILEIGFGTGLGFIKTYEALSEENVLMVSYEIQAELIDYFINTHPQFSINQINTELYEFKSKNFTLQIKLGDARKLIQSETNKFHAIYQDAYSPRRNPYLWTVEWFKDLIDHSDKDVIMSTYSASSSIRKSMLSAGFKLYSGDKFGKKRTSTRARLKGESETEMLAHLERSPALALRDEMCENYKKRD
tara:strand:+ start:43325 stop:43975 length:651 start_codon:yes stop_codon:yes gene_type:complete